MPTLLYSPGIRIVINTRSSGQIDVSDDIEDGSLTLNENAPHSLQFHLSNPDGKYNQIFTPNDSIVVQMKRLTWMQVFSGYLNEVPFFSVYNRSINLTATCTLKRIQYHWWDPSYQNTIDLLQQGLENQNTSPDGGLSNTVYNVLTQVVGWNGQNIHIGSIPPEWLSIIVQQWSLVQGSLNSASNSVGGVVVAGTGTTSTGTIFDPNAPPGASLPATYGLATFYDVKLSDPSNTPGAETGTTPLHVDEWWSAMNWGYAYLGGSEQDAARYYLSGPDESYLPGDGKHLIVANPDNGRACILRAADDMGGDTPPAPGVIIDISPTAFTYLFGDLAQGRGTVNVAWAPPGTAPGIYTTTQSTALSNQAVISALSGNTSPGPTSGATEEAGQLAANFVSSKVGNTPYGRSYNPPLDGLGPNEPSYDCSSLVGAAWDAALNITNFPSSTSTQWNSSMLSSPLAFATPADVAVLQPGDLLYVADISSDKGPNPQHVGMYVGAGNVVDAPRSGLFVQITDLTTWMGAWSGNGSGTFYGAKRPLGSANNTSTNNDPFANGTGNNSSIAAALSGLRSSLVGQGEWFPGSGQGDPNAGEFVGLKTLMHDSQIMPVFSDIVSTSMRNYCSGPNGDFIAWFPDYFGTYGYAAQWILSDIEMHDFNIAWSDANLVTHQFTAGSTMGSVINNSIDPDYPPQVTEYNMIQSYGVASIDLPALFQALFNIQPTETGGLFTNASEIYQQFGPRPAFSQLIVAAGGIAEFWYAVRLWMQSWASQFSASVPMTFMPELWPGMLLVMQDQGVQAYIHSVTHQWSLQDGGGFSTHATVVAPSAIDGSGLFGLPRGGTP